MLLNKMIKCVRNFITNDEFFVKLKEVQMEYKKDKG